MSIAEIRNAIRTANWNRRDATGGTREENARTNLPAILLPHVATLEALVIPPRFARDIEDRATAIAGITAVLARWNAARDVVAPLHGLSQPVPRNLKYNGHHHRPSRLHPAG